MANIDEYLPCENYQSAPNSDSYPGFKAWQNETNGQWYFAMITNLERIVLRSEGYASESGRNNGIESVNRNRDIEERYAVIQDADDGMWYVALRAGNRQEIARSCPYASEADATNGVKMCFSTYIHQNEEENTTSNRIVDEYLDDADYENAPTSEQYPGFRAWHHDADGRKYFCLTSSSGRVLLRSQGYNNESGRNNGIESVMRNRDLEERYVIFQDEQSGKYFVSLRAGNRQEIARSVAYDTEGEAIAAKAMCFSTYVDPATNAYIVDDYLPCEAYADQPQSSYEGFSSFFHEENGKHYFTVRSKSGKVLLRSEAYTSESGRNKGIESVMRNRDIEERYAVIQDENDGQWYVILRAGNRQEIARSCALGSQAEAMAWISTCYSTYQEPDLHTNLAAAASLVIEDYLPCKSYEGQKPSSHPGFTEFTVEETGLHYFAMVDDNGKVLLKSEGYTTAKSRANGIESVIRNRDIKERWVQSQSEHGYYMSLRAGNNQEIARTCTHNSESSLLAWWVPLSSAWVWGRKGELVDVKGESSLESIQVSSNVADTPVKVQVVEETAPLPIVEEVLPEPEVIVEEDKGIGAGAIAAGLGAAALLSEVELPKAEAFEVKKDAPAPVETKKEYEPQWKKKEKDVVIPPKKVETPIVPPVVPPVMPQASFNEAAAGGGGGNWWKWLLPLLLLGLLFLLWKSCGGCNKPVPPAPAPTSSVTPPPALDTAKKAEVPAPPPAPKEATCDCNNGTDPVFNLSGKGTPKSLTRLGTNPEFGDSHGLSPEEFYTKLEKRSKASGTDKRFLDRMFKAMGYKDGFSAAKPEMFSAVELAPGTVGNIGYSKAHKTLYARLDTEGKDLKAFRIKSANGCDLHFMKTCGNHFFFCPN